MNRNPARTTKRLAFTLVELLVVIGIIALLMSILLPTLSKARESAKKVQCQSNLKQIATAIIMYADANKGCLPWASRNGASTSTITGNEDFLYWQAWRVNRFNESPIWRYMNGSGTNPAVLRCPSDQFDTRTVDNASNGCGPYNFSYVMNFWIAGGTPDGKRGANAASWASGNGHPELIPLFCPKLTQVRHTSDKIMVYEEDVATIDDMNGYLWTGGNFHVNLLALRHDWRQLKQKPDTSTDAVPLVNIAAKGNVVFCDGHADFVSREFAHSRAHAVGKE